MTLPNFLIIGAAKSGTTSLYKYLSVHPQVFMSPNKETNFFAYRDTLPVVKGWGTPPAMIVDSITSIDEYKRQFRAVESQTAIGEASPLYLYSPEAPENIRQIIPETKLVAILRNPVDRAFSHFMHLVRDRREPLNTFREAVAAEEERMEEAWTWDYFYTDMGRYYTQLSRYFELFNKSRIKILLYDDLLENSEVLMRDLFTFLNVNSDVDIDTSFIHNPSGVPRSRSLHKLLSEPSSIKTLVRRVVPEKTRNLVGQALWERNLEKTQISDDMRRKLRRRFHGEIQRLEKLIERDLSSWLQ